MFVKKPLRSSFLVCALTLPSTFAKTSIEPFPWQAKQVEKKSSGEKKLFSKKNAPYIIGLLLASTIVVGASIYIAKKREEEIAPTSQKDPLAIYCKGFFINKNFVWHQSLDTNQADIMPNDTDNKDRYICDLCYLEPDTSNLLIASCPDCTVLVCFGCLQEHIKTKKQEYEERLKEAKEKNTKVEVESDITCPNCKKDFLQTRNGTKIFNELQDQKLRNQLKAKQEELRRKNS